MEQKQINTPKWTIDNFAKSIPALLIGTSSTFYILGLIIVNVHLSNFGIYTSDFARAEYVLAGAVYVFQVALVFPGLYYIQKFVIKSKSNNRGYLRILITIIAVVSFSLFPLLLSISFFTQTQFPIKSLDSWVGILGVFLMIALIKSMHIGIRAHLNKNEQFRSQNIIQKDGQLLDTFPIDGNGKMTFKNELEKFEFIYLIGYPIFLAIMLSAALALITLYAVTIYPYINTAFGGGDKNSVIIYPTSRGIEISKELALPISKDEKMVGPLEVLTETDKELIILMPSEISGTKVAIRINKTLIDALQTVPSYKKGQSNYLLFN